MKPKYIEGPEARENFEKAMRAAFQTPKKRKAPAKPKPKRSKGSDKSGCLATYERFVNFEARSGSEKYTIASCRVWGHFIPSIFGSAQESDEVRILGGFLQSPSEDVRGWNSGSSSGTPMGQSYPQSEEGSCEWPDSTWEHRPVSC